MTRLKDFALRFSILRSAYKISTRALADILGIKTNGNITMVEKGQCFFSFDVYYKVSELFAVEDSWLLRHGDIPYTENTMPRYEQLIRDIPIANDRRFIQYAPEYYSNYDKRISFFSLQDRANIVFLVYYYNYLTTQYPYLLQDTSTLEGYMKLAWHKIRERVETRSSSFKFQNTLKEFEYVKQSLDFILYNPDRISALPNGEITPSSIYIPPLYQVYDFQNGDELRKKWYCRAGDR